MASTQDWARTIGTTLVLHLKEEEQTTFRATKVFAMLSKNGNVAMNQAGRGFDWQVRYRNIPMTSNDGASPRVFARHNLWMRANLPYRGYSLTDSITVREMLENRGQAQLIDVAGGMVRRLKESADQALAFEAFLDGYAPGNEQRFIGLESMFSCVGADGNVKTVNVADGTARNANAADPFGFPNDEYAGIKCGLGAYAGSQREATGSWPRVAVDPEYDFWSPLVCNYGSTHFGGATRTWKDQCLEAIRTTVNHAKRNDTKESQIDMVLVDRQMYIDFLNRLDQRERAIVTKSDGLRSFGFSAAEIDGIEVASDYAMPQGVGYAISIGNMEMKVMTAQLLMPEGPYFNQHTQSHDYAITILANIKMKSPRNFAKFVNLTPA